MSNRNRLPINADGDFYTLGCKDVGGNWMGECLACGLPEAQAPELLAPLSDADSETYFIRQPFSQTEIKQAIAACHICCVGAIRYAGRDKKIIKELGDEFCDYRITAYGDLALN